MALFDKAVGPGRVIVSVDVTINHDQVKVTREDVVPLGMRGGDAVGSMTRSRTTVHGETSAGAVAGAPGAPGAAAEPGKGASSTSEMEFQNGRRIEQVVSMPGSIRRLSVGVVLPAVLEKARVDEIRQLVATTVGLNPSRGDEIAISALSLSGDAPRGAAANGLAVAPLGAAPASGSASGPVSGPAAVAAAPAAPAAAADSLLPARRADRPAGLASWPVWVLPLALIVLLLLMLLLVWVARGRAPPRLSPQGREEALLRVQAWLRADGTRP
ncbi:MAG: hypothetical protein NTV19_13005 [Burkholderiales bacterium]|nr:hypothetical protein [Burkholderiales bacterium]